MEVKEKDEVIVGGQRVGRGHDWRSKRWMRSWLEVKQVDEVMVGGQRGGSGHGWRSER